MRHRLLRPLSIGVVLLIVGLSVAGYLSMRRVVAADERRILTERGAAVTVLLQSVFQQEIATSRVLAQVAEADPADMQKTFAAGAKSIQSQGVDSLGIARPTAGGFVVRAAVGDGLHPGTRIVGRDAHLLTIGLHSQLGTTTIVNQGKDSRVGINIPMGKDVAFLYSVLTPRDPIPPVFAPFSTLRGAVYASPDANPRSLVMTTEAHLPLTGGPVARSTFLVGDSSWTLVYGAKGTLVGGWTANLPWLVLGVGLGLAILVAAMVETLSRRQSYANHLVTERTRSLADANADLDDARMFMRHLVSSGPVVAMVVDAESLDLTWVSPNISRLFGATEEAATAPGYLSAHVDPEHLDELRTHIRTVNDGKLDQRDGLEFRMRMRDGELRWVDAAIVHAASDRSPEGTVIIYALDIDARHHAEAARAAAQDAADRANRSKSEFLSRMSHELRTPLNAILGYAQILQMESLAADQEQPVAQILTSGRHLLDLINEVLDISRIEVGRLSLSVEPVAVQEVMETALDMVRPAAVNDGIELHAPTDTGRVTVMADRQRLRQILLNLLSNAVKYNRHGGSVTIACEPNDDGATARITVTDTGPGISTDQFDLVFAPFERLGAQQADVEGTGIGLALSRHLAEAMGGTVGLHSTVGVGSTFWVELPVATDAPIPSDDDLGFIPGQREDEVPRRTVLHVEDNPANLRLIERVLSRLEGTRLLSATRGRVALDLVRHELPDVVLLDLHLPDLPGEQVLKALRDDPRTCDIPVVVVSADATPGQIERLMDFGATAYLTKPINVHELLEMVAAAGTAGVAR